MAIRLITSIAGLLVFVFSSALSAQTLVYEREYTLIDEPYNTLRIEVGSDDRMTIHRPETMTRSGTYELQAPSGTYVRMRQQFEHAKTESVTLHHHIQLMARSGHEDWIVTDPEFSRFQLLDEQRNAIDQVTVVSLEAWAERLDDPRLEKLSALENAWFELMDKQIRGVEP